jgi:Ca-activated chloride channel family protein
VNWWRRFGAVGAFVLAMLIVVAGCQPSASASGSPGGSAEASRNAGTGDASLDAPDEVEAGADFEVSWTGPDGQGDYITVVAEGTTEWTNEPYFYTSNGPTGTLVASTTDGDYEIWYVTGGDEEILARRPITVTPFEGALAAPAEVEANTVFEVSWNGPDGPGDYVTIVAEGADRWTNESYFYTANGPTGMLTAPIEDGAYEIWYVAGSDDTVFATRPITVTPYRITLQAPTAVDAGAEFEVEWTGPDGPGDYITIVPAGSPERTYFSFAYTASGSPATITAGTETGNYEIRYIAGTGDTLASFDIVVR